jgi:hypothetical protein
MKACTHFVFLRQIGLSRDREPRRRRLCRAWTGLVTINTQAPRPRDLARVDPVLKNLRFDSGSYHGYGIHDFLSAEPRFAADAANADNESRSLVDAAHAAGLYVIFDIVLNHSGDVFAYDSGATASFSPTPREVHWRDENGVANLAITDVASVNNPSRDAFVWPKELQSNRFPARAWNRRSPYRGDRPSRRAVLQRGQRSGTPPKESPETRRNCAMTALPYLL